MEQTYHFTNWTSAVKMKNEVNPCLTIDIGVLRRLENENEIDGYQLTVIDTSVNRPVYKVYIDVGLENTWSLSTNEAIEMLNQIGFPCAFDKSQPKVFNGAKEILRGIKDLGYTHISRGIRPAQVFAYPLNGYMVPLDQLTTYNYHDFWMVENVPTRIDALLED